MNLNSGTRLFLYILLGCVTALIITLVIVGLIYRKKKVGGFAKFVVIFFSIMTAASFITFPLAYHNYIPVNLQYGYYKSVDETNEIRITRSSARYSGGGLELDGKWTLNNDELVLAFPSKTETFTVKSFGTELYKDGVLAYRYMTGK